MAVVVNVPRVVVVFVRIRVSKVATMAVETHVVVAVPIVVLLVAVDYCTAVVASE